MISVDSIFAIYKAIVGKFNGNVFSVFKNIIFKAPENVKIP